MKVSLNGNLMPDPHRIEGRDVRWILLAGTRGSEVERGNGILKAFRFSKLVPHRVGMKSNKNYFRSFKWTWRAICSLQPLNEVPSCLLPGTATALEDTTREPPIGNRLSGKKITKRKSELRQ